MYGHFSALESDSCVCDDIEKLKSPEELIISPPDKSEWVQIFKKDFQGKSGAVANMAKSCGIPASSLSKILNAAGIYSGKGGRPRKVPKNS